MMKFGPFNPILQLYHKMSMVDGGKYDAVISGAGPAGLASAYEFIQRGYKVLVVDTHEESIRPQLVYLPEDTIQYLKSMVSDFPLQEEDRIFLCKTKQRF